MISSRRVAIVASTLVVIGGVGFFVGGQMASADNCVSGTYFQFEPVTESKVADLSGNTTAFENLTAVEQRIFLEAYTDSVDGGGYSDTYADRSEEWFSGNPGTGTATGDTPSYVAYHGEYYEPQPMAVDCGVSTGGLVQIASILSGLIGAVVLAVVAGWRGLQHDR